MPTIKHEAEEFSATDFMKPKSQRRYGACNPCRLGKTKCDGKQPCTTCRQDKKKRRICEYSSKLKTSTGSPQRTTLKSRVNEELNRRTSSPGSSLTPHDWEEQSDRPASSTLEHRTDSTSMHLKQRTMSTHREIDEMIRIQPVKGRAIDPTRRVRQLWSALQNSMRSDSTNASSEETHGISKSDSGGSLAMKRIRIPRIPTEMSSAHDYIAIWHDRMEMINRLVDGGKLMQGWTEVAVLMPSIISYETEYGPLSPECEKLITPICIQLVELDCILSFFTVGGSLPFWSRGTFLSATVEKKKSEDILFATKLSMYETIQRVLDINTSTDRGIQNFLQAASDVKNADPITELEKLALAVNVEEPLGKQELKLISSLCFVILHCRRAVICTDYAEAYISDDSLAQFIKNIKIGSECDQVIKHAGTVLEAFESLCEIDPTGTAKCWLKPYGALMAGMLIGVESLRTKKPTSEDHKKLLYRLITYFERLEGYCDSNSIIQKAVAILEVCIADGKLLSQASSEPVNMQASSEQRKRGHEEVSETGDNGTLSNKRYKTRRDGPATKHKPILASAFSQANAENRGTDGSRQDYRVFLQQGTPVPNDPYETDPDVSNSFVSSTSTVPVDFGQSFSSSVSGISTSFHQMDPSYTPQLYQYVHPWDDGRPHPPQSTWHAPLALQPSDVPSYAISSSEGNATGATSTSFEEDNGEYFSQQLVIPDEPVFMKASFPPMPARTTRFHSARTYQNGSMVQIPGQGASMYPPGAPQLAFGESVHRNSTPAANSPYNEGPESVWYPSTSQVQYSTTVDDIGPRMDI